MQNIQVNAISLRNVGVNVLVFLVPALCLVTNVGIGLTSFLFLFGAALLWRSAGAALAQHWPAVRPVLLAFGLNALFVLLCFLLRPEQQLSSLEKPFRMACAVTALLLVLVLRPARRALWWGVIAGAGAGLALVGYQRFVLGLARPGGLTNAITFGDISLCLGLLALVSALDGRRAMRQNLWPALGALAGLLGSVLTGTRGGWLALVLAALLLLRHAPLARARVQAWLVASFALLALLYFVPSSGMQARVGQGIDDVRGWQQGGNKFTNVGIRLELWKGAGMLIAEHPLFGLDSASAHAQLARYVEQGRLDPVVLAPLHLHNDALQALVTGGVAGLFAWLGLLAAPFVFFARQARRALEGRRALATPALAGMLVVLCYFGFGLTEMMFWSTRACMFYALMIFMLMGFCLNTKE